jgi:hypothetical protein
MNLSSDHLALLSALNEHQVRYLIIGGYAVGFHSEPRATKDLDVYIRADAENSRAVFRALAVFGAPLAGLTPADFNDGESFFVMGFPPERIDVLQKIDGVTFDESWATRVRAVVGGHLEVPVISAEQLIVNKLAVGRPRDLLDVEDIREAQLESLASRTATKEMLLSGWNAGFKKTACTKLLRRTGNTLANAKVLTDSILENRPVALEIATEDWEQFASEFRSLGVKSVTET